MKWCYYQRPICFNPWKHYQLEKRKRNEHQLPHWTLGIINASVSLYSGIPSAMSNYLQIPTRVINILPLVACQMGALEASPFHPYLVVVAGHILTFQLLPYLVAPVKQVATTGRTYSVKWKVHNIIKQITTFIIKWLSDTKELTISKKEIYWENQWLRSS